MTLRYTLLADRGALALAGPDTRDWLQGLVSNDVRKVAPDRAIYATMLTPQGKFLHDFFVVEHEGRLLLDTSAARLADLKKRLGFYRLRSKVTIEDASGDVEIVAAAGDGAAQRFGLADETLGRAAPFAGGIAYVDPRLAALGSRAIAPRGRAGAAFAAAGFAAGLDYESLRLSLGVPEGGRDIVVDKSFLVESNIEELNGVDFDKGCYVGQETTTRTKRRGLARRRLMRIEGAGDLPPNGTLVMLGDREAGEMRSSRDGLGLALMRLEAVAEAAQSGAALTAGGVVVRALKPDWAVFQDE